MSLVDSMCMWPSMKPGSSMRPDASKVSRPSYPGPTPATWSPLMATSASSSSPVKTERTRPPVITTSAGSSPRDTASRLASAARNPTSPDIPSYLATPGRLCPAGHGQGHQGLARVQSVFGLLVHDGLRSVDDLVGDLVAAVGRETVHVERVRLGQLHAAGVADPVLVLRRRLQRGLLVGEQVQATP